MRDFNHTVNVLVKAYLNDTLIHGNCCACAVGNLIAESKNWGYKKVDEYGHKILRWNSGVIYDWYNPIGKESNVSDTWQTRTTGYTALELGLIERAFELAGYKAQELNQCDIIFPSLMAVVDVLAEIHGIDLTQREEAKLLFAKNLN